MQYEHVCFEQLPVGTAAISGMACLLSAYYAVTTGFSDPERVMCPWWRLAALRRSLKTMQGSAARAPAQQLQQSGSGAAGVVAICAPQRTMHPFSALFRSK